MPLTENWNCHHGKELLLYRFIRIATVHVVKQTRQSISKRFRSLRRSNIIFMTKMSDIVTKSQITVITQRFGYISKF